MNGLIRYYWHIRGLKWPTTEEALMWTHTEMGEIYELILTQKGEWVRNNPEKHKGNIDSLSVEIGDAVLMLCVACLVHGDDAIDAVLYKLGMKIREKVGIRAYIVWRAKRITEALRALVRACFY